MIKLREKDLEKLSDILQIPYAATEKMSSMNLINDGLAIDLLIIHDWKTLKRSKKYSVKQILPAIMNEYQVSKSKVEAAIYGKRKRVYSCSQCGRRISKSEFARNEGLCDMCISQTIKL